VRRWPPIVAFVSLVVAVALCVGPASPARVPLGDGPGVSAFPEPPGTVGLVGPDCVRPGERVTLECEVVPGDPHPSLRLWSATGGRVRWQLESSETVTWTAPRMPGEHTVACRVVDGQGRCRLCYRTVTVR